MEMGDFVARVVREIFRRRARGVGWRRTRWIREALQKIWAESDLTAGELCEVLKISMDELSQVLDEDLNPKPRELRKDCWQLNLEARLPLFIALKITGI